MCEENAYTQIQVDWAEAPEHTKAEERAHVYTGAVMFSNTEFARQT